MMKHRNVILLSSLIILLLVVAGIVFLRSDKDALTVNKNLFKVSDQTKIDKVIIENNQGLIKVEFKNSKWIVNDSLDADDQMIQVLFATLLQAEPKRPVAARLQDSISQQMRSKGTHVTLFESGKVEKQFDVMGNSSQTETYFKLKDDQNAYLVTIPGYRVFLAAIFELGKMDWLEKRLFNFRWENFKELEAHHYDRNNQDFAIAFQDGYFGLKDAPLADTTRLNDFLDAVSLVRATQYVSNDDTLYQTVFTSQPYYQVNVSDIASRKYTLELFDYLTPDLLVPARLNGEYKLLLQQEDARQIYRTRSQFLPVK